MPKKKKSYRRRARSFARRRVKGKIPLEMGIAGIAIPFTPAQTGWRTIIDCAQTGNIQGLMDNLKSGFIGMDTRGNINILAAVNPFDMESARFTKMLVLAGIVGKVRKKMAPQTTKFIKKIPLVGSWFS